MRLTLIGLAGLLAMGTFGWAQPNDLPATPPKGSANLNGEWEITAAIDNGEALSRELIHERIASGKITLNGPKISFEQADGTQKTILFIADPNANPATIDLSGDNSIRGIYLLSGETMMICLSAPNVGVRPTEFAAREGSHNLLMTLKKLPAGGQAVAVKKEEIASVGPAADKFDDETLRKMLIGTWGFQDKDRIQYNTLNPDGTFSSTWESKRVFRQIFDGDNRTSGKWHVDKGVAVFTVTASTEKSLRGQILSFRINSITDRNIIFIDSQGSVRQEWKVR